MLSLSHDVPQVDPIRALLEEFDREFKPTYAAPHDGSPEWDDYYARRDELVIDAIPFDSTGYSARDLSEVPF